MEVDEIMTNFSPVVPSNAKIDIRKHLEDAMYDGTMISIARTRSIKDNTTTTFYADVSFASIEESISYGKYVDDNIIDVFFALLDNRQTFFRN